MPLGVRGVNGARQRIDQPTDRSRALPYSLFVLFLLGDVLEALHSADEPAVFVKQGIDIGE